MRNSILQCITLMMMLFHSYTYTQKKSADTNMPSIIVISAVDVEEEIAGQSARVSVVELVLQPKEESQPHRHPGPVYGYVLEGTYEFKVEGQPLQTLKTGDTFYEPLMALHEIGSNPSDQTITRVLATVVHPRTAKRLVIPEKTTQTTD